MRAGTRLTGGTSSFESVDCLGVRVARLHWDELLDWFLQAVSEPSTRRRCARLFLANAHTLNLACSTPGLREALASADVVLNDGVGMDLCARLRGRPFFYDFNGTDLVPRLLAACSERGLPLRTFLFGARPGRADLAAERLTAEYPPLRVVGVRDGYHRDDEAVVAAINAARPDLLLVALGNPTQEEWIASNAARLDAGVAIGVGALFDFLSGATQRAPAALRALRLEWTFRLLLEPRRMFRRYVIGNPLFLWRALTWPGEPRVAPLSPAKPPRTLRPPPEGAMAERAHSSVDRTVTR